MTMSRAVIACIALFSALAQAFSRNVERGPLRSIRRNHLSPSMMDHNSIVSLTALRGGAIKQEVSSQLKLQAGGLLFLTSLLNGYTGLLNSHPYITKIVSSTIVGGLGDVLIQSYNARNTKKPIDLRRLLVFSMVTGIYIAPVIHLWFNFLAGMPFLANMSNMKQAMWMMFVDQTLGATIITMGFFLAFEMAQSIIPDFNGQNKPTNSDKSANKASTNCFVNGWKSIRANLKETMIANWYCWPIINFVNFLIIPLNYRVLFANFCAVFWNMYLSSIANRKPT